MSVPSLAGRRSVRRWSPPAGRPNRPRHLIFWTNWWDAHLATTLASDPTSKVSNTRCSLWGGVGNSPPPLISTGVRQSCAVSEQEPLACAQRAACDPVTPTLSFPFSFFCVMCCYAPLLTHSPGLWYLHTDFSFRLQFSSSEMSSYHHMSPPRARYSWVRPEDSLWHFPFSLRGHVSYIFQTYSTSLSNACWVNPSWLSIYTHTLM